ncbi:MATE family efflux transporter [Neobacillus ginsengisoli]|uniref:Probable multidrug resistance protein NorM n=1 Tax=Neobacillus ginsengisoli TaxID=904295 RepID=A0ABT9XWV3_9BACI|nr:MATE family efflux transporter [Neobacillus ginsengisoli]MDQ0199989.1 putative MATE family efflux protein [Neobacillus ginsengisoli]
MQVPSKAKKVFRIALPAIGESYLQSLLGVVDSFFIAKLGLLAINAVGVTNIYSMTYIGVFTAISATLSVFLSRAFGAKDEERSKSVIFHGLFISILIGLLFSFVSVLFANSLLEMIGANEKLKDTAMVYFKVVLGLTPFIALFTAQSASFRAIGDTKTPFRIGIEMNAVHVILDYVLIFGIGPFSGLGLTGAAIAMILARIYGFLRLVIISQSISSISLKISNFKVRWNLAGSMIKFAVPATLERLSMRLGQVVYFGLIVRMGTEVYATHNIAGTLTTFAYTVGGGFAVAASTLIGQAIGEKNLSDVKEYRKWSYIQSAISMTVITAILATASPWIGKLFTHNETVIHLLMIILLIDMFSQPFLASVLVDTSVVQAGGNSSFPMIVTMIGIWVVRTLGVYLFAWKLGFGLPAVWISIAADNALRAGLFVWYRRRENVIKELV